MKKDNALEILKEHQKWRKGGDLKTPFLDIKKISWAIDQAIQALEAKDDDKRQYMHPDEMMRLVAENLKEEAKGDPIDKMKGKL